MHPFALSFARCLLLLVVAVAFTAPSAEAADDDKGKQLWVTYDGFDGPGKGRHIVLVSGDEEYRSEEAMPQLGKILAKHHGFKCTVLFAIEPDTDIINPNNRHNIPGLEALKDADLMITALRFRDLPDEQMKHIDDYLKSGRPVLGMRTSTHAFNIGGGKKYSHYTNGYGGEPKAWKGGFGGLVLGDWWLNHHGGHKSESTRGIIAKGADDHPITNGLKDGDVWGDTDVYGVRLPLPESTQHIVMGQVLKGMKPDDEPVEGKKNNPMMPVSWVKTYQLPQGKEGKVFATTMGSSSDLVREGTRRMIVNAAYWLLDMKVPKDGTKVDLVGEYKWTPYSFHRGDYFIEKGMRPKDFEMKK